MNGVLVVVLAAAGTWLLLRGIKDFHDANRQHREDTSFLANHQRNVRNDQLDRIIDDDPPARWRP